MWEPVISKYLYDRLRQGDIFIDVGSNVGYHTLLASHLVGATGKVFAIEASSSTYAKLQKNLLQNKVDNVTAFHVAVSDMPGQLPVWVSDKGDSPGSTTLWHVAEQRETLKVAEIVEAKPLAQIIDIDTIRKARFIKIDVEGAEWAVVKSLSEIMKTVSSQTEFIIEVNDGLVRRSGGTVKAFLDYFSAAGFEPFVIANGYDPGFFANKVGRVELQRFDGRKFDQLDLVFRRTAAQNPIPNDVAAGAAGR
jgi:FkbM family methyltransferase